MNDPRLALWAILGLAAGGVAAWLWLSGSRPTPSQPPRAGAGVVQPAPSAPVAAAAVPSAVATPVPPAQVSEPALTAQEIAPALTELIGSKAVQAFLQTEDFPRRFVATVDNLGRSHAPPLVWPVNPTEGRFTTEERDGAQVIGADNSRRYTPFVLLVETLDIGRVVALYRRMSPLMQRAYVELGYPGRSFDARLIEVIDLLLATPDVSEPVPVKLTEVRGSVPSTRPWVRYEFVDPQLESLSAGQKMLIRTGAVNQRRLKARLAELRGALLSGPAPR